MRGNAFDIEYLADSLLLDLYDIPKKKSLLYFSDWKGKRPVEGSKRIMFNYANLSDTEFEVLCKDIMEVRLGTKLHVYTAGRDDGIDICDFASKPTIVIQAKHYINSTYSSLRSSIKKELKNLEKLKPQHYYVCTSRGLTPRNVTELFGILSQYMDSEENILGVQDIEDLLNDEKYKKVLFKHYKLGLSLITLNDLLRRDAQIDQEVLFKDILEQEKYFVPTGTYYKVLDLLHKKRVVILTGMPGSGKTMLSKMLVLDMQREGYQIIYVSDHNIRESMELLSLDETEKEFILLDDCFGQRYFELKSETGSKLMSLIKYVQLYSNKKLLMNSRITVYKEAKIQYRDFEEGILNNDIVEEQIDIASLTNTEKAQIFYNHLYFNDVPAEYMASIRHNRNYWKIIRHKNYMPRLIKHLTMKNVIKEHDPDNYIEFAFYLLNHPTLIWEEEYNKCLHPEDRIFVNVLYSLSDNMVLTDIHRRAFFARIKNEAIDMTTDVWNSVKKRLIGNLIKVITKDDREYLSVADPSVNDYLETILEENIYEKEQLLRCATEYVQVERLDKGHYVEMVRDLSALKLNYVNETYRNYLLLSTMVYSGIVLKEYMDIVKEYMQSPRFYGAGKDSLCTIELFIELLKEPYEQIFDTKKMINSESVETLLMDEELEQYPKILELFEQSGMKWFFKEFEKQIEECINVSIIACIEDTKVGDLFTESPMSILNAYTTQDDRLCIIDFEAAANEVFPSLIDNLIDCLYEYIDALPNPFNKIEGIESYIEEYSSISQSEVVSYLEDEVEIAFDDDSLYEQYRESHSQYYESNAVDSIFR